MKTLAIGRLFGLGIVLIGIGAFIWFGIDAVKRTSEFYQWLDDVPMVADVDLSVVGASSAPFIQTCQWSHGEYIYLDSTSLELTPENFHDKMDGLAGRIEIVDKNGQLVESAEFNESTLINWGDEFILARIPVFEIGEYDAVIRIDSPADNIAQQRQRITVRYQLCGLELMPAYICGAMSVFSSIVALVSGIYTVPWARRFGIWSIHPPIDA